MLKQYLKDNILISDGAMGTYYGEITGKRSTLSEYANKFDPEIVRKIHREYIDAGAKLIRTNTFSVNTHVLDVSRDEIKELLTAGYKLASKEAHGRDVFIGASIGPIPEVPVKSGQIDKNGIADEYKFIVDIFLDLGVNIFVFETFSSTDYLKEVTEYIKIKEKDAFILTQFAVMGDGYTRKGIGVNRIIKEIKKIKYIDAYGFNCGVGPTHLYNIVKFLDFSDDIISVLPNAGFPEIINERTVYSNNPEYFADVMEDIKKLGVKIIGGCCGTTPAHISEIAQKLGHKVEKTVKAPVVLKKEVLSNKKRENIFNQKLKNNEFPIAVELDPPFKVDIDSILNSAKILKNNDVDLITISDCPLGRTRINSIMTAAKIIREVGIDAMPHICCRDRNIIGLKSDILAGYMEGIRNILAVTGDPIPSADRSEIKSVFNLNSVKLIRLISELNKEEFEHDNINIGGALNLNVVNKDSEIRRMKQKVYGGATFFLTQPIYEESVIEYLKHIKKTEGIKILGGIMPVVSLRNALFLNNEIPGINISQKYINQFKKEMIREEAENIGIQITIEIANKIKDYVDGFYFIVPFNRAKMIVKIIKSIL